MTKQQATLYRFINKLPKVMNEETVYEIQFELKQFCRKADVKLKDLINMGRVMLKDINLPYNDMQGNYIRCLQVPFPEDVVCLIAFLCDYHIHNMESDLDERDG